MQATAISPRNGARELLRLVLLVFGGELLALYCARYLSTRDFNVFGMLYLGPDFPFFYEGARAWLSGRDPYTVFGFVTPPPSLLLPALLTHLSGESARRVFFYSNAALIPLTTWWYGRVLRLRTLDQLLFAGCAWLFASTQQCIRGGNMDGLMFALLVAAFSLQRKSAGAMCLAASIGTKLYSVILFPVLLRRRQWRFAAIAAIALLLLMLPLVHLWPSAIRALQSRDMRLTQRSISPAALFLFLTGSYGAAGRWVCLAFWLLTLFLALYNDRERELTPQTAGRYVPWMFAWPALVFSYVGVIALAALGGLLSTAQKRPLRRSEYLVFVGFLVFGIQLECFTNLMPLAQDRFVFFRILSAVIQSCGVVFMMLGTCLTVTGSAQESYDEAGKKTSFIGHAVSR
jgi:hypothetical protein